MLFMKTEKGKNVFYDENGDVRNEEGRERVREVFMGDPFMLRPMEAADLPRAKFIGRQVFARPSDRMDGRLGKLEEVWGYMFHEADGAGDAFGYAYLAPRSGSDMEIFLHGFALLPEKQGQGLGTRIMQEILDRERPRGQDAQTLYLSLMTSRSNMVARRLYRKLGFIPLCAIEGHCKDPGMPDEDAIYMIRALTPVKGGSRGKPFKVKQKGGCDGKK